MDLGNGMITICSPFLSSLLPPSHVIWPALFLQTVKRSPLTWDVHHSSICHQGSKSAKCCLMLLGIMRFWAIFKRTGLFAQAVLVMPGKETACVYNCRRGFYATSRDCGTVIRPGLVTPRSSPLPAPFLPST